MKLWRISQDANADYDTYDEAIVAAETEDAARETHPDGRSVRFDWDNRTWCHPDKVKVEHIGEAAEGIAAGVVLASFNAG